MNLNAVSVRIQQEEGFRLDLYHDSQGVPTIGYGTNISRIDATEATFLLQHRLLCAETDLLHAYPWVDSLDDVRAGVLLDMCYNMGIERLAQFTNTLAAVRAGDWAAAHDGMLDSLWAKQVGPRAMRLADMMLTGKEIAP